MTIGFGWQSSNGLSSGKLPIRNVRVTIIGDSISATSADWHSYINKALNLYGRATFTNHAVAGAHIMNDYEENLTKQVGEAANDNADIIIIEMGTNDNAAGDMDALQAMVETNLDALKISNPNANIYYMNLLPRWTDTGGGTEVALSTTRNAIKAACIYKSVTCWDTHTDMWIAASNTIDGLHPNDDGHAMIGARAIDLLNVGVKQDYPDKVLSYASLARYYPLDDAVNSEIARELVEGDNAAPSGVVFGTDGFCESQTVAQFDGSGELNLYSTNFQTDFPYNEGSLILWAQVTDASIWLDGVARKLATIFSTDFATTIKIEKMSSNNNVIFRRNTAVTGVLNPLTFVCYGLSWSVSNNRLKAYINGAQTGVTQAGESAWTAAGLAEAYTKIGTSWKGKICNVMFFNEELSSDEFTDLADY